MIQNTLIITFLNIQVVVLFLNKGFNLYNKEPGIPENCKIKEVGLGYLHDIILAEC